MSNNNISTNKVIPLDSKTIYYNPEKERGIDMETREYVTKEVIKHIEEKIDLNCCVKTLYRRFQDDPAFDARDLPTQGKRKANHHVETRGRLNDRRRLEQRQEAYPD